MKIRFICKTNYCTMWIDTARFVTKTGTEFVIDRDRTEWTYDAASQTMEMTWRDVYVWDGKTEDYGAAAKCLDGAQLVAFEIEDDAPEDYQVEPLKWKASYANVRNTA